MSPPGVFDIKSSVSYIFRPPPRRDIYPLRHTYRFYAVTAPSSHPCATHTRAGAHMQKQINKRLKRSFMRRGHDSASATRFQRQGTPEPRQAVEPINQSNGWGGRPGRPVFQPLCTKFPPVPNKRRKIKPRGLGSKRDGTAKLPLRTDCKIFHKIKANECYLRQGRRC
jgi:hypothetical protein